MSDNVLQKIAETFISMLGIDIYNPSIQTNCPINTKITIKASVKELSASALLYLIEKIYNQGDLDIDIGGEKFKIKLSIFPIVLNNVALGNTQLPFQTDLSLDTKTILALAQRRIKFRGINNISISYWVQRGGESHDKTK